MGIHARQVDPDDRGPLDSLRVLDMSRLVAGNMLTLQLGDFGAEVVKIEALPNGDPLRAWGDSAVQTHWKTYCRNKKKLRGTHRDRPCLHRVWLSQTEWRSLQPGGPEALGGLTEGG